MESKWSYRMGWGSTLLTVRQAQGRGQVLDLAAAVRNATRPNPIARTAAALSLHACLDVDCTTTITRGAGDPVRTDGHGDHARLPRASTARGRAPRPVTQPRSQVCDGSVAQSYSSPMAIVCFPDGTRVRASSISERRVDDPERTFGLYLDAQWQPTWPATLVDW